MMVICISRFIRSESQRYDRCTSRLSVLADINMARTNIRVTSLLMKSSSRRPMTRAAGIDSPSLASAKRSQSPATATIESVASSV